jgi:hypothetical protein
MDDIDTYQTPSAPASWRPLSGNWDGSGSPLMLDTRTAPAATTGDPASLTQQQAAAVLDAAVAGLSESGLRAPWLDDVEVSIVDLPGRQLGRAVGTSRIELDIDAANVGWFVDSTPDDNREFRRVRRSSDLRARPGSDAEDRVDLLTVLLHEFGHLRGEQHAQRGVMQGSLPVGTRRLSGNA